MSEDAHTIGDIKWYDDEHGDPIVISNDITGKSFCYYWAFIKWQQKCADDIRQLINYAEALVNQGYKE